MKLVVTIDTEEDQWGQYDVPRYSVANAGRLPAFQALCEEFAVRPTYLVTYEMARQDSSAAILRDLAGRPGVEIGGHCHPWNTPPPGETTARSSMLSNLPRESQRAKLTALTECLVSVFGIQPRSYRAGRWGFHPDQIAILRELGYQVDTSITPFISWENDGGPDYARRYPEQFWLGTAADTSAADTRRLLEVPATVGFLQSDADLANRVLQTILRSTLLRRLRVYGVLGRLRLLNRVWICPEMTSLEEMIALTSRMKARGAGVVNLMFHSVTLQPGLSPFVRSESDATAFAERLRGYFAYCRGEGIESTRLQDLYGGAHSGLPVGMP
ncbi:polysaccharide deacetylase family protein [Myxococcota bacterium]|nr:polysaccharide deacetylase family protein [Myxococcota bacterium]